jgi:nicotinamidase-related amidase
MRELPVPDFYRAENARSWSYQPELPSLLREAHRWRAELGVRTAANDRKRVHMLLVDLQRDFCFPEGALFVGGRSGDGAIRDNDRLVRFLYRNLETISDITYTLDSHVPHQIFFPSFWADAEGGAVEPGRVVHAEEVRSGALRPNPEVAWWLCDGNTEWLRREALHYCEELERQGKYELFLWPLHCLMGGDGHALAGVVQEARLFHAWVRGADAFVEHKGMDPLTENYSVFSPEVKKHHDGSPLGERNVELLDTILGVDALVVAGQASSHCVKSSLEDLLVEIERRDRSLADRVYILDDCMSAVTVRDPERPGELAFDFTDQAEEALERFARAGMHRVRSEQPIREWPGFVGHSNG